MILKRKSGLNNCSEPLNLALPHLPCSGTGASGSVQHPLAEPIQLRAAIARPLQEFQFRDLAFDLPVTVRQDEGTLYGGSLTLYVTHWRSLRALASHSRGRPRATGQGRWPFVDESSGESAGSTDRPSQAPCRDVASGEALGRMASTHSLDVTGARRAAGARAVGNLTPQQGRATVVSLVALATLGVAHRLTADCASVRGAAPPRGRPCSACLESLGPAFHARVARQCGSRHPSAFADRP